MKHHQWSYSLRARPQPAPSTNIRKMLVRCLSQGDPTMDLAKFDAGKPGFRMQYGGKLTVRNLPSPLV
jgi:hypothetical protein